MKMKRKPNYYAHDEMVNYQKTEKYWTLPIQRVFDLFQSNEKGLTDSEAQDRLKKNGYNEIYEKENRHGMEIFFSNSKIHLF